MGLSLETAADPAVVGFDAGWTVELRKQDDSTHEPVDAEMMSLSRQQYFAQIKVETQALFRAGTFEVIVEGLNDTDYRQLVGGSYVFVKVLLGWRDLGSGGGAPFGDLGALLLGGKEGSYVEVIHGRLTAFERLPGTFQYRTRLAGVDYRFHKLRCTAATQPEAKPGDPAGRYAELLCEQAGVPVVVHPREPGQAIDEVITIPEGSKVDGALRYVARRAHGGAADRQIPLFLRSDGLHFGPWTAPVVVDGPSGETRTLELRSGLVEVKPVVDPNPDACAVDALNPPVVLRFDVTMRGRADIAVGDKVEVEIDVPTPGTLPSTTSESILGGLGDMVTGIVDMFGASPEPTYSPFRVISVRHELDRTKGFVTTLRLERQEDDAATKATGTAAGTEPAEVEATRALDEAAKTAIALAAQARESRREVGILDIAQVNAQWVKPGDDSGHAVGAQRVDVQEGLDPYAAGNATVRAQRRETPTQLFNKPYLTPFAFGAAGLVIPHYPGTRVVDLHYREDVSQTVVAGCLWDDAAEPESEYGDWWLSLPTNVATPETIADSREAEAPSGPASHDLIALDGTRALHLRGLRISVGEGKLPDVGIRPDAVPVDEVLIEHKSGAKIHIDASGNITFEAASDKNMTFKAKKITLDVSDSVEVT